jgi:hypothetical protein
MTYLILHKVRGEPAFDIAEKMQIAGEEGWIIPTSGHRAYPYQKWHLEDLIDVSTDEPICSNHNLAEIEIPTDWPDHYQIAEKPAKKDGISFDIGLVLKDLMPTGKFPRRA